MPEYGPNYDAKIDGKRIKTQMETIREYMLRRGWKTLSEIHRALGYPEASVSSQLRHLKKAKHGRYDLEKRRRKANKGLWEYRLRKPKPGQQMSII